MPRRTGPVPPALLHIDRERNVDGNLLSEYLGVLCAFPEDTKSLKTLRRSSHLLAFKSARYRF